MKIAVIIPDRKDRPKFLENCLRMIGCQTMKVDHIELVDYVAESNKVDITQRYRRGYDSLKGKGFDLIALMENDDYYHPEYIEIMANEWERLGKPDLFGTNTTIYYHLCLRAYFLFKHDGRASAMNTFIKPDIDFEWCKDSEPYTDIHLWRTVKNLKKVTITPQKTISIGIKHGVGLCGGRQHNDRFYRFEYGDLSYNYLQSNMDAESYNFYSSLYSLKDRNDLLLSMSEIERNKIKTIPNK